jgi:hypothetical protein
VVADWPADIGRALQIPLAAECAAEPRRADLVLDRHPFYFQPRVPENGFL